MDCNCHDTLSVKDVLKELRGTIIPSCGGCGMMAPRGRGIVLKVCSRCKVVNYCSPQCQRESWAYHKQECSREEGKGLTYFTQKIFNNPLIRHYLELALIYEFELHKATPSELKGLPLVPFDAFMDLIIEPRDLQQRAALLDQKGSWNHAGVEGVVLINAVFDSTARLSPQLYSQEVLHMMRTALPGSHLVVLGIRHRSHRISTNIIGLRPQMIEIARKGSFGFKRITMPLHALSGPSVPLQGLINLRYTDQPGTPGMNGDVCNMVNHINQHIRFDKNNDYKLRTMMTERDKKAFLERIWDPRLPGMFPTERTVYTTREEWHGAHKKSTRVIESLESKQFR